MKPPEGISPQDQGGEVQQLDAVLGTPDRPTGRGERLLYWTDARICGNQRIPAAEIYPYDRSAARRFAHDRQNELGLIAAQALGSYLVLRGMTAPGPERVIEIPLGIALRLGAVSLETSIRTRNSNYLKTLLKDLLPHTPYGKRTVEALMLAAGVSLEQIDTIDNIPTQAGMMERGDGTDGGEIRRVARWTQVGANAATLPLEWAIPLGISGTILSDIIGEYVQRRLKRRRLHSNIAYAVDNPEWRKQAERWHTRTLVLNKMFGAVPMAVAQLSTLLTRSTAGSYAAISGGLAPLTAANATAYATEEKGLQQKAIVAFLRAYNSPPFIFTDHRLQAHFAAAGCLPPEDLGENTLHGESLRVTSLLPHAFDQNKAIEPISFLASIGRPIVIGGPNGTGKTSVFYAICHRLEHTGTVQLEKIEWKEVWPYPQHIAYDIHSLGSHEAIDREIMMVHPNLLQKAHTVPDLFISLYEELYPELYEKYQKEVARHHIEVAYRMPDRLLMQAIYDSQHSAHPTFPKQAAPMLEELHTSRRQWLRDECYRYGHIIEPFRGKDPLSDIHTWSPGQRQTLVNFIGFLYAPYRHILLWDEPTANLDSYMSEQTLLAIKELSQKNVIVINTPGDTHMQLMRMGFGFGIMTILKTRQPHT